MSHGWNYKSGDWNITCDVCNKKIKASESLERWDGFRVCRDDWEPRHSLDFIRAKADKISVPFARPLTDDIFVVNTACTIASSSSYADLATADCATVGNIPPFSYRELLDMFVCNLIGNSSLSGTAVAGCAIPRRNPL